MSSGNWVQLGEDQYEFFEIFKTYDVDFKHIDLRNNNVCAAKYGGPIAITRNTSMVLMSSADNLIRENVCFFSNQGKLLSKVQFFKKIDTASKIVCFSFIEDELLLILMDNGKYYLLNPNNQAHQQMQQFDLGDRFKKEKIQQGKVFDNGFAFITIQNQFFYVGNVFEPHKYKQFQDSKLKSQPKDWIVTPKTQTLSEKVEIQITHEEAGVIVLVEDEGLKIYYNKFFVQNYIAEQLQHLENIVMIAQSPDYSKIAYLSQIQQDKTSYKWVCTVLASNFQDDTIYQTEIPNLQQILQSESQGQSYNKKDSRKQLSPSQILWCGNDCVVINTFENYILIGQNAIKKERNSRTLGSLLVQEMDCLRVITNRKQEIVRLIPEHYKSVMKLCSTEPGAMLLEQYQLLEDREPINAEDNFRSDKTLLSQAVLECIQAGTFELNQEKQVKLLRAASYGKTFLHSEKFDQNQLGEVCKYLRVANSLKLEKVCRILTYQQLVNIKEQLLVKLMLRYNLHYKAIEICKHLNYQQQLRQMIYIHWACQKVEQDNQSSDDLICEQIKQKLEKQNVSFTDIAQRAIQVGKSQLGLKLLENENSIAKKVPVLLWMGYYDNTGNAQFYFVKALEESLKSKDSNLIFLVVQKVLESNLEKAQQFKILSANPIVSQHLKNYLKNFDELKLQHYLQTIEDSQELGYLAIEQAFSAKDLQNRLQLLKIAAQQFNQSQPFYGSLIMDEVKILTEFKENKDFKGKDNVNIHQNFEQKSINDIFYTFLKGGLFDEAEKFRQQVGISDKRYIIAKIKVLIEQKQWDILSNYVDQVNKKKIMVPFELIGDLVIQAGFEDQGLQFILKMKDIEEQTSILVRIGQSKMAVDSAIYHNKFELLEDLKNQIYDQEIIDYINNFLAKKK